MPTFPAGLVQTEGSFRFSLDALLLAEFALGLNLKPTHEASIKIADLGTGCGIVALSVLRGLPCLQAQALGVDTQAPLLESAKENARLLGLQNRFQTLLCPVEHLAQQQPQLAFSFHQVLCNPPWYVHGQGRLPASVLRQSALFGSAHTLKNFLQAVQFLLVPEGSLALVLCAKRLEECLKLLPACGLRPRQIQLANKNFFLLEAQKGEDYLETNIRQIHS